MQLLKAQVLYNDLSADPRASLTVTALSLSPEMVMAEVWPATLTPLFHIWESRNACLNPTACQQHNPSSEAIKESAWFPFVQSRLWCLRKQASKDNIPVLHAHRVPLFSLRPQPRSGVRGLPRGDLVS